jgi:hypothetical protein
LFINIYGVWHLLSFSTFNLAYVFCPFYIFSSVFLLSLFCLVQSWKDNRFWFMRICVYVLELVHSKWWVFWSHIPNAFSVCSLFSSGFGFEFRFMCLLSSIIESSYTSRIVSATQYVSWYLTPILMLGKWKSHWGCCHSL